MFAEDNVELFDAVQQLAEGDISNAITLSDGIYILERLEMDADDIASVYDRASEALVSFDMLTDAWIADAQVAQNELLLQITSSSTSAYL